MLYLAEIKKQQKGLIGATKTELKLLAFQRNDQTWSPTPGEEIITSEQLGHLGEGALVMVNLSENRQIQGTPELAATQLVRLLQKLSRLTEKSKEQDEEIEQWKQSLTYQSQELSRREIELETRLEQLEQQASSSVVQSNGTLNLLSEQLHKTWKVVDAQQQTISDCWQRLDGHQEQVEQQARQAEQQQQQVNHYKQEWLEAIISLENTKRQKQEQQILLKGKQELADYHNVNLRNIEELREQIALLGQGAVTVIEQIDTAALENMPLGELEATVNKLRQELEKFARFVNDQEEELTLQTEAVQELQANIDRASEYDRIALEEELADEQERKRMLDETLLGQRRNLRERREILLQHLRVLQRRQGVVELEKSDQQFDLEPILNELEKQQNALESQRQRLETDIAQIKNNLQQIQETLDGKSSLKQGKEQQLQQQEESWKNAQEELIKTRSQIDIYQQTLEPLQTKIEEAKEKLSTLRQTLEESNLDNSEQQAIA